MIATEELIHEMAVAAAAECPVEAIVLFGFMQLARRVRIQMST